MSQFSHVQEMSVTTQNRSRRLQHYAHAHMLLLCFVLDLWILVFTLPIVSDVSTSSRKMFPSTVFHHASVTPSAKFFSCGCCSPTVSCHRPLDLYPKFLHIFNRGNGWRNLQTSPLVHGKQSRCSLLTLTFFHFQDLANSLFQFFDSVLENSSPGHLIYMCLHHGIQLLISWHQKILICFMFVHCQILS